MSSLEARVEKFIQRKVSGQIVNKEYVRFEDLNFVIVVNKVVWYAIHIILEVYNENDDLDFVIYKKSEHITKEGALESAENYKDNCKFNHYNKL
jgi:hypothetical protein